MNLLNQQLQAIKNSKTYCQKQLANEKDEHIRQKIQHYIDGYTKEEKRILQQLNIQLNDITLTKPYEKPEEEDTQWQTSNTY